jgi:DNA polymerase III epsilon subunit-like protein
MDILKLKECNKEQINFIESELKNSCLIGIPGGGKTTTIIKKIIYHIINNNISKKDFLIITFSKKACQDFIERGNNIIEDVFTKNNVKTIHSLAGTIINKLDKSKSESIEIVICKALNYINQYSVEELQNIKCLKSLKLIIIDEAQDISEIQYNLAKTLSNKLNTCLILVGDPNQNIYQFQNGTDKFLLEHSKDKYYLKQNYRSTPEIIDFINALKPWKNLVPDIIATRETLNKKPIIYAGSQKIIVEHMMETIEEYKKEGINLKDIAIIGPVKKSKENSYGKFNNIGLQYFVNYFEDNKIKYIKHYSETTSDCEIVNTKTHSIDGHINLYTIHGSKGLEFKKVFLLNFHTNTYGRNPTSRDYNNFRYLWYVGLSRACDDMIIYTDYTKNVWYEMAKCHQKLYKFVGKQLKFIEPIFEKCIKRSSSITELLKTKEIFTEEVLFELKNYLNFEVDISDIYNNFDDNNITDFEDYSSLYGKFIEQLFEYLYCKKHNKQYLMSIMTKQFISNRICLSKKFRPYITGFLSKLGKTPISLIEMEFINEIKNDFDDHEKEMYEEVVLKVKEKNLDIFSIYVSNELVYDNPEEIYNIADNIDKDIDTFYNLYLLNLYFYQYEHEAKYLWKQKDEIYEKIKSVQIYIDYINDYINTINDPNYEFQINVSSKYISDFNGIMDCYSSLNKEILEFKFIKNVGLTHYLQVFLYNFIKNNTIDKLEKMTIINFLEGKKYTIKINNKIDSFQLLSKLAKILNTKIRNLVILYDLETTGLINDNNYPEIIDRYFYEINLNSIIDSGLVKPNKKLPEEISKLTNITDIMLQDAISQQEFFNTFKDINSNFYYPTYIAHNGMHFDHKIMVHYELLEYSKVKFLDSRQIIINFTKNHEQAAKGKLSEMYKTLMGKEEVNAHRAGADVHMVLDIFNKLNIKKSMKLQI